MFKNVFVHVFEGSRLGRSKDWSNGALSGYGYATLGGWRRERLRNVSLHATELFIVDGRLFLVVLAREGHIPNQLLLSAGSRPQLHLSPTSNLLHPRNYYFRYMQSPSRSRPFFLSSSSTLALQSRRSRISGISP